MRISLFAVGVLAGRASKIIGQLKKTLKIEFPKTQLFNEHFPTNLKLNYELVSLVMSIMAARGRGRERGRGRDILLPWLPENRVCFLGSGGQDYIDHVLKLW